MVLILFASVYLMVSGSVGAQQESTEPPLHPWFTSKHSINVANEAEPAAADSYYLVDGKRLPQEFVVTVTSWEGRLEEHGRKNEVTLRFVLVAPTQLSIDRDAGDAVVLEVDRPYYITTTTLNQKLAALLMYGAVTNDEQAYDLYAQFMRARLNPGGDDGVKRFVEDYVNNSALPALVGGPGLAELYAHRLAEKHRLPFRLPGIAEWYAAMRAGADTRYWWGDEWNSDVVVEPRGPNHSPLHKALQYLKPTDEGHQNPLGIYHVFGNVFQVLEVSPEDAAAINSGTGADDVIPNKRGIFFANERPYVRPGAYVIVGGSVITGPQRFPSRAADIDEMARRQRAHAWTEPIIDPSDFLTCVGVRLALSIPPGRLEVRRE